MWFFVFPVPLSSDEQVFDNHSTWKKIKEHERSGCKISTFAFVRVIACGENMHFLRFFVNYPTKYLRRIIDFLFHANFPNIFLYNNGLSSMLQSVQILDIVSFSVSIFLGAIHTIYVTPAKFKNGVSAWGGGWGTPLYGIKN